MHKQEKILKFRIISMLLCFLMVLSSVSPMYGQSIDGVYGRKFTGETEADITTGSAIKAVGIKEVSSTSGSAITGEGTKSSPYIISTEDDLRTVAEEVNHKGNTYDGKYLKIKDGNSIELSSEWMPIGTESTPFKGRLDGSFAVISGIKANGATTPSGINNYGFFGYVESAEIKNLTVSGSAINYSNAAGIAGKSKKSSFINCVNSVNLNGTVNAGGISALDEGSVFKACVNKGEVISSGNTGGIAGNIVDGTVSAHAELDGCYNERAVKGIGTGAYTGGVAGKAGKFCVLTNCFNKGQVEGQATGTKIYTAGVAAYLGEESTIDNCYNAAGGLVTGMGQYTAGVFGEIKSNTNPGSANTVLTALYNAGTVTGFGTYTSGVLGSVPVNMGNNITYCYNTGTVAGQGANAAGVCGQLSGANLMGTDRTSRLNLCYNLGEVRGEGDDTAAAGINIKNTVAAGITGNGSWVVNCFNYGSVTAKSGKAAAITYEGYDINSNCCYLAGSAGINPVDASNGYAYDAAAFSSGEVAYALDKGDDPNRLENWGQGGNYPVPASSENPAVYKMTIEVTGDGENKVKYKDIEIAAGNADYTYVYAGKRFDFQYEVSDGYLLDNISFGTGDLSAVLDEESKTFSFTMRGNENISVFVKFVQIPEGLKDTYTVTYDANGGRWMNESTYFIDVVKGGGRTSKPDMNPYFPSSPGINNIFKGWFIDEECTVPYNFTSAVIEDITIFAGWVNEQKYTVIFDATGGLIEGEDFMEKEVITGNAAERPENDPIKAGFDFRGWYSDENCLYLYDFESPVTGKLILYAGWASEGQCVIVFDANGGTVARDEKRLEAMSVIVDKGESVSEPSASREPKGSSTFDLDGWYTSSGSKWGFAEPVTQSMTLTAEWKENYLQNPLENGSYEIDSLGALEALRDIINGGDIYENATFVLTRDIELPSNWMYIGTSGFNHTFDGGGNTIYFNENQKLPIFKSVSGTVKDLKVEAGNVSGIGSAIAYTLSGGEISGCEVHGAFESGNAGFVFETTGGTIRNCTLKSGTEINGAGSVAGIIAVMRSTDKPTALIENCTIESGVTLTSTSAVYPAFAVSGIAAYSYNVTIQNCTNGAEIVLNSTDATLSGLAAGIVATKNGVGSVVNIKDCVNTGNIRIKGIGGKHSAGGIAGTGGASLSKMYIENSYSLGNIYSECESSSISGVAGNATHISNSYWYGESLSNENWEGSIAGITANEETVMENCYYGIKSAKRYNAQEGSEETDGITDPFDGKGATKLTAREFEAGKAAYLLDGGMPDGSGGVRMSKWSQDFGKGHPILKSGEPVYMITVSSEGGSVGIADRSFIETEDDKAEYFEISGQRVNINAVPETEKHKLKSILAEDLDGNEIYKFDKNNAEDTEHKFTMPDSNIIISAKFELQETVTVKPNITGYPSGAVMRIGSAGSGEEYAANIDDEVEVSVEILHHPTVEGAVSAEYYLKSLTVKFEDGNMLDITGTGKFTATGNAEVTADIGEKIVFPPAKEPDDDDDDDKTPNDDKDTENGGAKDDDGIGDGTGAGIGEGTGGGTDTSTDGNQEGTSGTDGIPADNNTEIKKENNSTDSNISQQPRNREVASVETEQEEKPEEETTPPPAEEEPENSEEPEEPEEAEEASTTPAANNQKSMIPPIAAAVSAVLLILIGIYRFIILKKKK